MDQAAFRWTGYRSTHRESYQGKSETIPVRLLLSVEYLGVSSCRKNREGSVAYTNLT